MTTDREFERELFATCHPIANVFLTLLGWAFNLVVWLFLAALFIRLVGWVFHG